MVMKAAVAATVLVCAASAPLLAQDAGATALERGRRSISFTLPGGGGTSFGLWTMLSDRTNLGLNARLEIDRRDAPDVDAWAVELAPAIRRYVRALGPVMPFLYADVSIGFGGQAQPAGDESVLALGTFGGIGVEWFPVRSVSIGGYTGIGLDYTSTELDPVVGGSQSSSRLTLRTATSQLGIQIYFGGAGQRGGQVADEQ